ncbi:MAG: dTDP-4-dehydrorhamnose 3,5-epimerase family protein [Gemmataceae bacterium]|nr:dTDP-4-dehydrorhamnose 3,5-epimerase family protein [Gemmataceae bacterium]
MEFHDGTIEDVIYHPLRKYYDGRGWLCELFRHDDVPAQFHPVMAYVSETEPGVTRGPHEHVDQADYFCFIGPSNFKVVLWDNRPQSPTYRTRQVLIAGADSPALVVIPPGVVHGYKNVGTGPGLVFNAPNRLYRGPGRKDPIDEIRHEDDTASPFRLDDA